MFQKWSQLKCTSTHRRNTLFAVAGLSLVTLPFAQISYANRNSSVISEKPSKSTELKHSSLPQLLQEVEKKYSQAITLSADFEQIKDDAVLSQKQKSSGKIFVKRPSKIRWETIKPEANLLVSDGEHLWFYTPPFEEDRGRVVEKKASEVNSKLVNALLSGSFSVARDMKIKQVTPSSFLLIPKPGTAGTVIQAEIHIDPEQKIIQKVILEHKGGNRSEILLSQIQLGKNLENELFVFKAPPNTEKVEDR